MLLNIQNFIDLSKEKSEIRHKIEKVHNQNMHIFHYMIATPDLFKTPLERECRGITFNDHGECVCRPFSKFFNIGEREETLPHNIDWNNIGNITYKVDGSLVMPVNIKGQIFWKTKKSFYHPIVKYIQNEWNKRTYFYQQYNTFIWDNDINEYTLLFEYVSPNNRIVIDYKKEDLCYLARRLISTGEYEINPFNVLYPPPDLSNYNTFLDFVKNEKEKEGYVLYTKDGTTAYKIKTQWYLDRHHLLSTLSYKTIFKMIIDDRIDDIIAELRLNGYIKQIDTINILYQEYMDQFYMFYNPAKELYDSLSDIKIRKDFAIELNKRCSNPIDIAITMLLFKNDNDSALKLINKYIFNTLSEKYLGQVLFMGEPQ